MNIHPIDVKALGELLENVKLPWHSYPYAIATKDANGFMGSVVGTFIPENAHLKELAIAAVNALPALLAEREEIVALVGNWFKSKDNAVCGDWKAAGILQCAYELSALLSRIQPGASQNCPTCASPGKHLHPAMQYEGEVQPCVDQWHTAGPAAVSQPGAPAWECPPPCGQLNSGWANRCGRCERPRAAKEER